MKDMLCEKKTRWLREYGALELECLRLEGEIARWRSAAERTSRAFDALPGGKGGGASVVEKAVDEISALELELVRRLRLKTAKRREIEKAVEAVADERLCGLLRLRYIECKKWHEVSEAMFYSEMQVMRLHREALELVELPVGALVDRVA